jgi:hypothetical protein
MKKMLLSMFLIFFATGFYSLHAQYIVALDDANNYSTWDDNSNEGFGFESWELWTATVQGGSAGHFIGSSGSQGFGNIDVNNKSFGMYGNPSGNNFSNAQRLVSFWGDGAVFSVDIAVAYRNGTKGIDIFATGYENIWNFNIGSDKYSAASSILDWEYSQTSIFSLSVTQDGDDIDIMLERGTDSYSTTISDKTFIGFKFYNGSTEAGNDLNNLFFNNLKVEYSDPEKVPPTSNVQISGDVVLGKNQTLTVNDLNIPSGNSFTISSESDATGSLIVNGTATDLVTIERHIAGFTSSTSGWHFLSSPVSAQPISDFHTAGSGNDFYKWDEPSGEWINRTVTGGGLNGSFETNFAVGAGYLIANGNTSTKEFSGTLNVSDVPVTGLTNTGSSTHQGWHLLGNPFSSAIKFNQGTWAKTNIGGLAQIWNESTASYKVLAGNQIIPAHNGFMVYTTGSGSLTIPADARLHSDSTWYKNAVTGNEIILIAHDPEGQTAQETIISFNPDATEDFDLQYDSYYLSGFAPNFYSISQNQLFALNAIPPITENLEIQLGFIKNQSSSFTIELLQTIDDQTLYLTDQKTDYTHKLSDGPYHFTSTAGDDPNRFLLRFSAVGIEDVSPVLSDHVWVYKNNLLVNNVQGSIYVEIFDLMGRRVHNAQMAGDGLSTMYLDQPAGVYVVKISTNSGVHTIKATLTN